LALILIVEDEPLVAQEIKLRLEAQGHQVLATAETGEDALNLVNQVRPELVLMDIGLKGAMDGVDTAASLWSWYGLPVIYLSGYSDRETVMRARHTGAFGYLVKPVKEHELEIAVEMAVMKSQSDAVVRASEWWLRNMLSSFSEAVIATDAGGVVRYLNPEAERQLDRPVEKVVGKPVGEVLHLIDDMTGQPLREPFAKVLTQGATIRTPQRARLRRNPRDPDDEGFRIQYAAVPLKEHDFIAGMVIALREGVEERQTAAVWSELVNLVSKEGPRPPG